MTGPNRDVLERKLAYLRQFLRDLGAYAPLAHAEREREHYAIERLLQLLCEVAADVGLQFLKRHGWGLVASYRDVFAALQTQLALPPELAQRLIEACAMRNLLTHLYETIDLERVAAAVEPALDVYGRFLDWALARLDRDF
jgi:uncharacterized protein YutE (UPF0331/DUF86 family)